jgi:hypothetical protein
MTLHKFAIGQAVDFDSRFPSMSKPAGPFEVMSALPIGEDNSPTYRVKSNAEPFARVARETDLVAIGLPPSKQTAAGLWADLVSGRRASRAHRSR